MAQSSSVYIAGFETTSITIAFALYHLACHSEHQATLYDEIQTHLSGKKLIMELIDKLSFLDCVVYEALRLYPPLPVLDRTATRDYEVIKTQSYICINN